MEKDKETLFEIISIKYPKKKVTPKNWKGEELKDKIELHYRFKEEGMVGEGIVISTLCCNKCANFIKKYINDFYFCIKTDIDATKKEAIEVQERCENSKCKGKCL